MTLDQTDYVNDLEVLAVSSDRKKLSDTDLNPEEHTQLRSTVSYELGSSRLSAGFGV